MPYYHSFPFVSKNVLLRGKEFSTTVGNPEIMTTSCFYRSGWRERRGLFPKIIKKLIKLRSMLPGTVWFKKGNSVQLKSVKRRYRVANMKTVSCSFVGVTHWSCRYTLFDQYNVERLVFVLINIVFSVLRTAKKVYLLAVPLIGVKQLKTDLKARRHQHVNQMHTWNYSCVSNTLVCNWQSDGKGRNPVRLFCKVLYSLECVMLCVPF